MRRLVCLLLAAYVFAIPWEYSLDLGQLWGNVARVIGLLLVAAGVPALLGPERTLRVGRMQALVLALFLWLCLTTFWSIDQAVTLAKLRAFFQEMMVVFLVWEFARTPHALRWLLRTAVAGCWVLALLTLAEFRSVEAIAEQQLRAAAFGQDPNDVARFLDLGLPLAALLGRTEAQRSVRWMALGYLPVALLAALLTASRGGLLAAVVALVGSTVLLLEGRRTLQRASLLAFPALLATIWIAVPAGVLERLATIPEQLQAGNLNERVNIWQQGWHTFRQAPLLGYGAGNFTLATGLRMEDTAHNTALALVVAGGLVALFLATLLAALAVHTAWKLTGPLRTALLTALAVFAVTTVAASVEENRFTWLLVALVALSGRLNREAPEELSACFADPEPLPAKPATTTAAETP
jgi:O-antigen ligase